MKALAVFIVSFLITGAFISSVKANELSIYEIQYTTDPNGTSTQHGNIID